MPLFIILQIMLYKYPRTYHLPWSKGITNDDKIYKDVSFLENRIVVISEKMDGENTSIYTNYIHARSIDSKNHPSRNYVKNLAASFQYKIPNGWRVCGENMFATHSIYYDNLKSFFLGFAIYDERNICLPWKDTLSWFKLLGITPVPIVYYGKLESISHISDIAQNIVKKHDTHEGYVIRIADMFTYEGHFVAKYVRENHVKSDTHWKNAPIVHNMLDID